MPALSISCLGHFGRFGNQLFQYAFAKAYAEKYNCQLYVPDWCGRRLFKHAIEPLIDSSVNLNRTAFDDVQFGQVDVDLWGYFQHREALNILSIRKLREWFEFKDEWLELFPKTDSYAAAHVRRGDYRNETEYRCLVSDVSYRRAAQQYGVDPEQLVWISEEHPHYIAEKEQHRIEGIEFLPDFFCAMNADILFRSNSTFGWWAGLLGQHKHVYSPIVLGKAGWQDCDFVEGNWPALQCPIKLAAFSASKPPCDLRIDKSESSVNWEQRWVADNAEQLRYCYPLTPESVVLDVGAYEGGWLRVMQKQFGCHIYAFEPVTEFYLLARQYVNSKTRVFNYGLGGVARTQPINVRADASSLFGSMDKTETVEIVDLPTAINWLKLKQIDVLKLNVEGAEYEILESILDNHLERCFVNIQVQFHRNVENAEAKHDVIRKRLMNTHELTFDYPFVWENYRLK